MDPLEIIDYLEQNVDRLEHGGTDPTGFWPHKCGECCYFEGNACALDCLRYRDLKLVDYVVLRIEEEMLLALCALSNAERRAFLAWFAGGSSHVIKYADRESVSFGKAECEWVPFSFWLNTLPSIGWITIDEVRRGIAKGAVGHPEFVEYEIKATDKGFSVREAFYGKETKE